MSGEAPTIFESFNARALTADQVAATFVPSPQFEDLCKRRHTIVLGPRGSGKTTLLKMLQPLALETWRHASADTLAVQLDFTGVFVATDISWSEQLAALGHGMLDAQIQQLLSNASFTAHTLRSLVIAFEQRCGQNSSKGARTIRRVNLDREVERAAVTEIAGAWYVEHIVPTLFGLRQALTRRLLKIREIASREILLGPVDQMQRMAQIPYLHLHFLQASGFAIEAFEHAVDLKPGKWALLFDELELAPSWIHTELVRSLRSTDDRFLFKLALNPFSNSSDLLQAATSAAPGEDFDQIPLWYAEKRDAYGFCEDLWKEVLREKGLDKIPSPASILGPSYFESLPNDSVDQGSAYSSGSRWAKRFAGLASRDATFRRYLRDHDLDPAKLDLKKGAERASEVRKIAPIVAVRNFYRRSDETPKGVSGQLRSRKNPTLYAGADSIFAITEGNPRWFIGLMSHLLSGISDGWTRVDPAKQASELVDASQRFTATLRTIPMKQRALAQFNVVQLVRLIGRYFHAETVLGDFRPEPPGSFTVDASTPEPILGVLSQALNAGAMVYVPDDDGKLILTSLRGKRFRLSYLLAPLYGFPIRLGKSVSLSRVLSPNGANSESTAIKQLGFLTEQSDE